MSERFPGELGERIHRVVGERKLTRSGRPTLLEVGLLELRMRLERQAAAGDERTSAIHRAIARTVRLDPDRIDPDALPAHAPAVLNDDRFGSRRAQIRMASRTEGNRQCVRAFAPRRDGRTRPRHV